ncbi:hypothetical protein JL09_g5295 [Pichia kudriavzevii]|uniref:Uncharacterized protein n=1 Tax=Pichia kudriavzevii TaxID=4909 RepID=A0A099NSJ2_PICKU|nr:hypothetical protein JL09_g5295 [Pichia kudriavzevii]
MTSSVDFQYYKLNRLGSSPLASGVRTQKDNKLPGFSSN